jgi:UDP-N-acetylmuramyl pentapeptide synthase
MLSFPADKDLYILEMGTGQPGELPQLCQIAQPEFGLITNIYPAHLEYFQTLEQITQEKAALFQSLPAKGVAFVNSDDEQIVKMKFSATRITFGFSTPADTVGKYFENSEFSILEVDGQSIRLSYGGWMMAQNALAAYTVGKYFQIPGDQIKSIIESFALPKSRGTIIQLGKYVLVDDTYNANPASTRVGIRAFLQLKPHQRHIAVLGDMLELGPLAREHHQQLGEFLSKTTLAAVFACGELTRYTIEAINNSAITRHFFAKQADLAQALKSFLRPGDVIYLKGSRGMQMENLINSDVFS